MATRLILNELDLNLSALATGLVIIIVIVFCAHSRALGTAVVSGAIAGGRLQVVLGRRRVLLTDRGDVGHDGSDVGDKRVRKWINRVEKQVMVEPLGL